ncbi:MAG: hypothetical protein ABW022_05145 [Actinoplanes sp.]
MGSPTVTAPPVFGLRKNWVDPGPGIAMVQIHYTWGPHGEPPDWTDAEEVVLTPRAGRLRSAVIEVPRDDDFSLHHFFFVVGVNDRAATAIFTEHIVGREVTYEDPEGAYTAVGFAWSAAAPELEVPNYTSTAMDGLPFESAGSAPENGDIYEFVRAQPLPHVFRGRVWGLHGTQIRYAHHLIRHGLPDPAANAEAWDDNGGEGWTVEL